jgi:hypothetical protein
VECRKQSGVSYPMMFARDMEAFARTGSVTASPIAGRPPNCGAEVRERLV